MDPCKAVLYLKRVVVILPSFPTVPMVCDGAQAKKWCFPLNTSYKAKSNCPRAKNISSKAPSAAVKELQ